MLTFITAIKAWSIVPTARGQNSALSLRKPCSPGYLPHPFQTVLRIAVNQQSLLVGGHLNFIENIHHCDLVTRQLGGSAK
jgi:hypothetical protein